MSKNQTPVLLKKTIHCIILKEVPKTKHKFGLYVPNYHFKKIITMTKNKSKKYAILKQQPLITQPTDVYYNGKKLEFNNENYFVDDPAS